MNLPSAQEMEAYIRQAAQARGIDPDVAVRVARSEGLKDGTWQATGMLDYGRERSYGPFQLHLAPQGYRQGLGNDFYNATKLDPSDPRYWKQGVDFALDTAARDGWGRWFGRKNVNVGLWDGINGAKAIGVTPSYSAGPGRGSVAGYRTPGTYSGGEYVPGVEKTFYDDRSPLLPGNDSHGVGASLGGFSGGPSQVAARNPVIQTAAISGTGDMRPTNFQRNAARQAMEGDQSQKARLLQAAGLDPTGKTRIAPRGTNGPGILETLKGLKDQNLTEGLKLPGLDDNPETKKLGIISNLFSLFG
ncbi:MAG: hypothetical protein RLZZ524_1488 [Pseudomonadota bacterium]|jgi:hypothetical protein